MTHGFHPDHYMVKFWAPPRPIDLSGSSAATRTNGLAVMVKAEPGDQIQVIGFVSNGRPFPGVDLDHFVRRAIAEVRSLHTLD